MNTGHTYKRYKRIKLIFNPASGANNQSPVQLMDIMKGLQDLGYVPEPYLTKPDSDMAVVVREALADGMLMFVVCGGDGTVSAAAKALLGTNAVLCIIPTGTQNNVARSLGIPTDIPAAIDLLRSGRYTKVDMGYVLYGEVRTPFLEVCSIGLFSALFLSSDEIQHGNISRVGDFLATLTASPPANIHLTLDNRIKTQNTGYAVLVSNMTYVGRHHQVGLKRSFCDGFLDVLFCAEVPKIDLVVGYILKGQGMSTNEDSRIHHYLVRTIDVETDPAMPVMVDGKLLGEGSVKIEIQRQALTVITGSEKVAEIGENIEE